MLNIGLGLRQLVGQQFQQFQVSFDKFWDPDQFMLNQISIVATGYVQGLYMHISLNKTNGIKHQILGNQTFDIYFQYTYKLVPDLRAQ